MKKLFAILFLLQIFSFAQQKSVAVLPSDGNILKPIEQERLTDKIRVAALKVLPANNFILLKQDAIIKRLGGAENYLKECKESSCIVDLGKKAQVDYVAQASIGDWDKKLRLKIELYDVKTEGLIDIYDEVYQNIDDLINDIDVKAPDMFKKISSAPIPATYVKPPPAPVAPPPAPAPSMSEGIGSIVSGVGSIVSTALSAFGNTSKTEVKTGLFTDYRDGNNYKTINIGNHVWMAENLNYEYGNSWCYENKTENCEKYGRLYDWNTAMKVCPSGWHLSSRDEWGNLAKNTGGREAGKNLKSQAQWDGIDFFGFSALAGGRRNFGGDFSGAGYYGYWWSSTENSGYAYCLGIGLGGELIDELGNGKSLGFSVRCVKNSF